MQKELEELLHRHREKMVICCEETCLCWDIEALLAKHEAAQQSVQADLPETWAENEHPSACIHRQSCIFYKPASR